VRGKGRFWNGETGEKAEKADAQMNEIVMEVQAELDGAKVVQTRKACNCEKRVDATKNQAEEARAVSAAQDASDEGNCSTKQMKQIVGGRKGEIKHFMAKEAGDADDHQDQAAQNDIGSC